jgi:hypothetical protein
LLSKQTLQSFQPSFAIEMGMEENKDDAESELACLISLYQ